MSEQEFEFISEPHSRSVKIIFRGFWNEDVVRKYREALRQRAALPHGSSPITKVLLDLSECSIQSRAVIDSFGEILGSYAGRVENYGMILPKSALLKLQMKRLMLGTTATIFEEDEEASLWLSP